MAGIANIGPVYNLRYHLRVFSYLGGSPTPQQAQCLLDFFNQIKSGTVQAPGVQVLGRDIYLVGVCGHIVEFRNNGTKVTRLTLGVLP